jgi:hypothetical protein
MFELRWIFGQNVGLIDRLNVSSVRKAPGDLLLHPDHDLVGGADLALDIHLHVGCENVHLGL